MPEPTIPSARTPKLPGLDSKVTPMLGVGLGLTGLLLGLRPRLAAWPLALTAVAAMLYRDPERVTPDAPEAIFAPADGVVIGVEDVYEHRFLHTDAVRVAIAASPFDVPVHRSPAAGRVGYIEHVHGEYGPIWDLSAAERPKASRALERKAKNMPLIASVPVSTVSSSTTSVPRPMRSLI